MTLRQPAVRWQDALPCGNGTLGALVYGHILHERVVINHEALWFRTPRPRLPDVSDRVPALRQMLAEGRYLEARKVLADGLRAGNPAYAEAWVDPYHPAFNLDVRHTPHDPFSHYRRRLDFAAGIARVDWRAGDAAYFREVFVSRADDLIVMRIGANRRRRLGVTLRLAPHDVARWDDNWFQEGLRADALPLAFTAGARRNALWIAARYTPGTPVIAGGEYGGRAEVLTRGGRTRVEGDALVISDADEILVRLAVAVHTPRRAAQAAMARRLRAAPRTAPELRRRHVRLHRPLFTRVHFSLAPAAAPDTPNEDLLAAAYDGAVPAALVARLYAYGRYLFISSSRAGGWPANLQGVWNGNYFPAWSADYHHDENLQMCYWQALSGDLPDSFLPYVDYIARMLPDWRRNARRIYGCRGVLAPIAQALDGRAHTGVWLNWTAGAGWLAQLVYDYWLYTGDRDYLRRRALPILREVAAFYEDFLTPGPDGRLMFAPSISPENVPNAPGCGIVAVNATMDVAVAREVLGNLCAACETLGLDPAGVARWRALRDRLPPYAVNPDGALKEWLHPDLPDRYTHRHLSHLYPLFPGREINREDTPELFKACKIAVEKRLVAGLQSQAGWSFPHMAGVYARLGAGDRALECLHLLTRACVGPNLFTYHNDWRGQGLSLFWGFTGAPPFQIDANLGVPAAIHEMLVQSRPGFVALWPALPGTWSAGALDGVRLCGGGTVRVRWTAGELRAELIPAHTGMWTIRTPGRARPTPGAAWAPHRQWRADGHYYIEVAVRRGRTLRLTVRRAGDAG